MQSYIHKPFRRYRNWAILGLFLRESASPAYIPNREPREEGKQKSPFGENQVAARARVVQPSLHPRSQVWRTVGPCLHVRTDSRVWFICFTPSSRMSRDCPRNEILKPPISRRAIQWPNIPSREGAREQHFHMSIIKLKHPSTANVDLRPAVLVVPWQRPPFLA